MLKIIKRNKKGHKKIIEEKPELRELELTAENIRNQIGDSDDVIDRELLVNGNKNLPVDMFMIDGLVNTLNVDEDVLKPLLQEGLLSDVQTEDEIIERIIHGGIYHNQAREIDTIDEAIELILVGGAVLVFSKVHKAIFFDVRGFEKRSISEPTGENVVKGAKDSFIEVIRINTASVRRKLRTQNLRIIESRVGQQSYTQVAVVYIEGTTDEELVKEVQERIDKIDVDGVLLSASFEEYVIDEKFSPFPQMIYTERPDKFCQYLMEGRVGILIDGLPLGYILPAVFDMFFQAPEDYANNFFMASFIRMLRYFAYLITLLLPGFYVALTNFHQEMIPTALATSIIKSKEGIPFPDVFEVLGMLIAFELLIEAGIRLPKAIGQAVSIVGAIVVGQAAVEAKLVSPAVVIVVALTGIAGFTLPNQDFANASRLWRLILLICASAAGLYGLVVGLLMMGYQLVKTQTFGVPYLTSLTNYMGDKFKTDTLFRLPMFTMTQRPGNLHLSNKVRQNTKSNSKSTRNQSDKE